jgi:hypothetical protein
MARETRLSRRNVLQIMAGSAALATGLAPVWADEGRIARLIVEAKALPAIGQRVDFIAHALLGSRYRGFTLIGGPRQPEKFVVRDDGFDCVTYCETVLAAAIAHDASDFEASLRAIRYHHGIVAWRERNHYFFEWGQHNIENKTCRAVGFDGGVALEKSVYWHRELGRRRFSMTVYPRGALLANKSQLAAGDIVGFVSRRPNLDYFHVGFIAFGDDGELLLRHASQSHARVLDERMDRFFAVNGVGYVTLWRPQQPPAGALTAKKAT